MALVCALQPPNREFWGNVGGLVRDGVSFVFQRGGTHEPLLVGEATTLQSKTSPVSADTSSKVVGHTGLETATDATIRQSQEQRDKHMHSSQQRIKVVGSNATGGHEAAPSVKLKLPGDNSMQLKEVLGMQGTTAAQITLSQLELQEQRQVQGQLQKLGLPTEGSIAELKDRLKHAREAGKART